MAPALGEQAPARAQGGEEATEEVLVIGDPVEDRVRVDQVDLLVKFELRQVALANVGPVAERLACLGDHR